MARRSYPRLIVVAILLLPYSLLLALIPIFEHCAAKDTP